MTRSPIIFLIDPTLSTNQIFLIDSMILKFVSTKFDFSEVFQLAPRLEVSLSLSLSLLSHKTEVPFNASGYIACTSIFKQFVEAGNNA